MAQKKSVFQKMTVLVMAVTLALSLMPAFALAEEAAKTEEAVFQHWNEDAPALNALISYVEAVTDENSPDYIPKEDRIAVFDLDGTLMCETYPFCFEYMVFADYALKHADQMPADVLAVAQEIVDAAGKAKPDGMSTRQAAAAAVAYQGMTMDQLAQIVRDFKDSEAWGFTGMKRGEAYYKPMLEVFDALLANDFTVYIVTATERNIVRAVIEGTLDIPPSHVIGTEYGYTSTNQGGTADTDYTFQPSDQVVFDGNYYGENAKMSKVDAIVREIGQQPVLAFGNSSGDLAMEIYTISNNPYRSAAFMVAADDEVRDYGNAEKAEGLREKWESLGCHVISMANDWKTIYGEDVAKTGEFHQPEVPAPVNAEENAAPEAEMESSEETGSVQYVLYLGTNDKDTNKPVFTQAEAIQRTKEILLKHFGGYTIQEAHGGWIDNGIEYQEYTLVIYLSDTTLDAVHAAADEMIETFRQSSVLIQANPTKTEFYSAQPGTAGSNIPLKDNAEEAEYQIKVAMQYLLEKAWGDKVNDARIYVEKVYTSEEEQADVLLKSLNLGLDEVAFAVCYELHPAEGVDIHEFLAGTGEYDEESGWVKDKTAVGILRPNAEGEPAYVITEFGTGF